MNKKRWQELQKQSRVYIFRAYYKKYGMIYPEEYFTLASAIDGGLNFFGSPSKDYDTDECIFSQYTGLKDKQGNPVYEGDIVKATQTGHPNKGKVDIQVVAYELEHPYCLSPFGCIVGYDGELWIDELEDGFEVIGNIYEHPEMLKG